MNPCFPDWNFESDPPFSNQRNSNPDLMELLYRNGQVVAQSQTYRRSSPSHRRQQHTQQPPPKQHQQFHQTAVSFRDSDILDPETVTTSWIEYPIEDSFDKEFSSHFFIKTPDAMETDHNPAKKEFQEVPTKPKRPFIPEPPPRIQQPVSFQPNHKGLNFGQFSTPEGEDPLHGSVPRFVGQTDVKECSRMTVVSSHCGSNHVQNAQKIVPQEKRKTEVELNVSSSSDGSGSSYGGTNKNSSAVNGLKRKGVDVEDSEGQSEAAEQESAGGKKSVQQSGSTRKSRAAEVHNQSERKRRDRINKKMRALQELIPHCNKTDKASMLDEAIEYLKSLQLQLQMMLMGGSMAPMMFQGMQPCMSPMAMGMGAHAHPMSTAHNNMNLPKVPMADQTMPLPPMAASMPNNQTPISPILNPMNFHHMQNQSIPDQFARYMAMHQMQATTNSQPMNMFRFGPQMAQPPQTSPVTIMGQHGSKTSSNDALSSKIGQ